ncbi:MULTISPECIES: hypothetical protein [unclassified Natrinema]|uniref:hypothetical protein n=1 Tax=unclassified Natrinema TaxID=2622230 RepID=UPI00026D446A|nr:MULTISPECIES: hypothetical protein [unclassified Natrinema]AFO57598.1 hypothetical protein NJ7G_2365 [Natrinema sp. J7-2]
MTVIGEKTATWSTLLDDLAGALLTFSNWSDADSYVVNDGTAKSENYDDSSPSENDWHNNGRVLQDSKTGLYLLMYLHGSYNIDGNYWSGVRFVLSTDWESAEHHPAGYTTIESDDARDGLREFVGTERPQSYDDINTDNDDGLGFGIWGTSNSLLASTLRETEISYLLSVNSDGFNSGVWNDNDGNDGIASVTFYDYLSDRFFDDPGVPLAFGVTSSMGNHVHGYGFSSFHGSNGGTRDRVGYDGSAIEEADWGIINPSSEDDTFFFRYPAVFKNSGQTVPVAYVREVIPNDTEEGGAHGDDFSHDGTDYKIFKQSGASSSNPVSLGLRHE